MPDPVDNKIIDTQDDSSSIEAQADTDKLHEPLASDEALQILGNSATEGDSGDLPSVDILDFEGDTVATPELTSDAQNTNQSLFVMAQAWEGQETSTEAQAWQSSNRSEVVEERQADKPESTEDPYEPMTDKELEAMAEAIDQAANGGVFGIGTDVEAINEQLKRLRTPGERETLDKLYRDKTGHGIEDELIDEMSGSDLAKSMELWKAANTDAARIHVGLIEHKESGIGSRSDEVIEKDLRDTVSTMNSEQIKELNDYYLKHHGTSVHDALLKDDSLPKATRDALEIYLKGNDRRTVKDTLELADIAIKDGNLEMFQEAMRDASPEAREAFLNDDGERKVLNAFGDNGSSSEDSRHALDYVNYGKLDLSTKIVDNTGTFNDNEDAIESAIKAMTDEERQSYQNGSNLQESDPESLTDAQSEDLDYFKRVNRALDRAGNEREVAKWEDMISHPEGTLVSELAEHGGFIDDGMDDVLKTIEDMSEEDWKRLKEDPEYRKQVEKVLDADLSRSEMRRANELLDRKLNEEVETFDESKQAQRDILDALNDESGFWNTDEEGVLDRLANMTDAEQARYRTDAEFKEEIDQKIVDIMDEGLEQNAAFSILESIENGENPEHNIISKFYNHANHFNTDEAKVVSDFEQALRDDPKLLERLRTDEDYRAKFDKAANEALDPDEYKKYIEPIIEDGRLSFKAKAQLYNGFFNDDEAGVFDALQKENGATEADWNEIIASPKDTLPFMSSNEREIALNIALQKGEMKPEDRLRAAMVGVGTETTTIQQVLDELDPDQLEDAKKAYLDKYESDLMGDLFGETGGRDRAKIVADVRGEPQSDREAFNNARDAVYESVDGIGRDFVDGIDGTGDMTMDTLNQYARKVSEYSSQYEEMPDDERRAIEEQLEDAAELYRDSKNSAADVAVDGVIIAAGVAAAKFTGGVSLSLLAYTSVGGAIFKVGAKSAIMGQDYDFTSADTITDAATGGIDAATMFLGPAQAAQMLKLGEKSAARAATAVLTHSDDIVKAGGKELIQEGAEEALEKKMFEHVAFAISNGSDSVNDKAIRNMATEFASSADEIPQLETVLKHSLNEAIQAEASSSMKATMRELALNSAAGNVGGTLSGGVYGLSEWDTSLTLEQNLAMVSNSAGMGGLMGTGMAGGFTLGFKGLGKSISSLKSAGSDIDQPRLADLPEGGPTQAVGRSPDEISVDNGTMDFTPESRMADSVSNDDIARLVQSTDGQADLIPGSKVKVDGSEAQFVRTDENSGRAILRYPERSHWAVRTKSGTDLSPYQTIEVDGKNYYVDDVGTFYAKIDLPEQEPMLMPKHEFVLADPGSRIEAAAPEKPPFEINQKVKSENGTGYVAGFEEGTGDVIVRLAGRENYVMQFGNVDNLNNFRPIDVQGKTYFRDKAGVVWDAKQKPDGGYMIHQNHEFLVMPKDAVSEVEVKSSSLDANSLEDGLDSPLSGHESRRLTPESERAVIPELPGRQSLLGAGERGFQTTGIYDEAQITLNGQQIGDLSYDGPPIELGRSSLGIKFQGSGELVSSKHATVKWDSNEQMFYLEEHSTNGTYIQRAGSDEFSHYSGGKNAPYRVYLGPNDTVRLGSMDGPELKLNVPGGENLKPQPGPGGTTDVRMFFDGQPLSLNDQGEAFIGREFQLFRNNSPGDILNRRVSSNHAKLKWNEAEQGWEYTDLTNAPKPTNRRSMETVVVRQDGNGTYIKRADGKIDFVRGQSTILRDGDRVHLGSPDGPELKLVSYQGMESVDGRVRFDRGSVESAIKRPDGTTNITDRLGQQRLEDPNGRVIQVLDKGGVSKRFDYDPSGDLNKITFEDGSIVTRSGSDKWTLQSPDGSTKQFWDGRLEVENDGSIRFTDRGRPPRQTIERVDGTREVILENGRVEYQNIDFLTELSFMNRFSHSFDDPAQGRRFKELMNAFEGRAREVGLSADEKARTFHQVRRLMTAEEGAFLTPMERSKLAEQIFNQASNPSVVSQGYNNTCNVATVEHRLFSRKPSEAARLIADVVISGKYVTTDGVTVDLARIPGVLKPDSEARMLSSQFSPDGSDLKVDGRRTYASQIFETTAVNLKYARTEEFKVNPGEIVVYEKPSTPVTSKGTGEELVKYSVNSDGLIEREIVKTSPHIYSHELTDLYKQISGTSENHFVIRSSSRSGPLSDSTYGVNNVHDLRRAIESLDSQGGKPGILQVHTGNEPFFTDSGAGAAGGSGGWHVVNVHGIRRDASSGKLVVDVTNQWGDDANHMGSRAIPLEELYRSTMEPPIVEVKQAQEEKGFFRNIFGGEKSSETSSSPEVVVSSASEPARMRGAAEGSAIDDIGTDMDALGPGRSRKLWGPARDIQNMDADERSTMLANIEQVRSRLNNDQAAEGFVDTVLPLIRNWEDLSLDELVSKAAREQFEEVTGRYQTLLDMTPDLPGRAYMDSSIARAHFEGDPEKLALVDEFIQARGDSTDSILGLKSKVDARAKELENAINEYAREKGLPPIKIELREDSMMGGAKAKYRDGVITLNRSDLINDEGGAKLIGSAFHEFTHSDQHNTILRDLADKLEIPRSFGVADLDTLAQMYFDRTGRNVDVDYLRSVLETRSQLDNMELPFEDQLRVPALVEAMKNNSPAGDLFKSTGDSFRVANSSLKKMNGKDPNAVVKILKQMHQEGATGTKFNQHIFGVDEPPAQFTEYFDAVNRYLAGDNDAWNPAIAARAREEVRQLLQERLQEINDIRRDAYNRYMQLHEQDAFVSGERARMAAANQGASEGPPQVSDIDGVTWLN